MLRYLGRNTVALAALVLLAGLTLYGRVVEKVTGEYGC